MNGRSSTQYVCHKNEARLTDRQKRLKYALIDHGCYLKVDLHASCGLSDDIYDYPAVSMGKVKVDSIDDEEEMLIMDVSSDFLLPELLLFDSTGRLYVRLRFSLGIVTDRRAFFLNSSSLFVTVVWRRFWQELIIFFCSGN